MGANLPVATKKKVEKVVNQPLQEEAEAVWNWRCASVEERCSPVCEMAASHEIQRKKMILKQLLVHQFFKTLDKNLVSAKQFGSFTTIFPWHVATSLFEVLLKYRPEDRAEKKERLLKRVEAEGKTLEVKKPIVESLLCLTSVQNEDKMEFSKILEAIKANFNDKYDETRKKWGGVVMGSKSRARIKAKKSVLAKEAAQRLT